jgi:hypothetical protein
MTVFGALSVRIWSSRSSRLFGGGHYRNTRHIGGLCAKYLNKNNGGYPVSAKGNGSDSEFFSTEGQRRNGRAQCPRGPDAQGGPVTPGGIGQASRLGSRRAAQPGRPRAHVGVWLAMAQRGRHADATVMGSLRPRALRGRPRQAEGGRSDAFRAPLNTPPRLNLTVQHLDALDATTLSARGSRKAGKDRASLG